MKTIFQDNDASDMGGGIFNRGYLVVENSVFQRNNGTVSYNFVYYVLSYLIMPF